jgi:hypothetical protein
MKIENLKISKQKVDINLEFYFFLKLIKKLNPSTNQINAIFQHISLLDFDLNKLKLVVTSLYDLNILVSFKYINIPLSEFILFNLKKSHILLRVRSNRILN